MSKLKIDLRNACEIWKRLARVNLDCRISKFKQSYEYMKTSS